MKKKIVYLLCELGLFKLAEKISASIAYEWRGAKIAQGLKDGLEKLSNCAVSMAIGIQEFAKQYGNKVEVSDVDRCVSCGAEIPEGAMMCPICERRYD